jgi:glycosyltransferase involved in cell wall biosynthesis
MDRAVAEDHEVHCDGTCPLSADRRALPGFAVVIPSRNSRATILRALESVSRQTYPPEEIILVDDGSTDGSAELVRASYPSVVIHSQIQAGAGQSRNVGIDLATSDWVAFLDADDMWLPHHLESLASCAKRFPEVDFLGSRAPRRTAADVALLRAPKDMRRQVPVRRDYFKIARRYRFTSCVHVSSIAVRRAICVDSPIRFPTATLSEDMAFFCSVGAVSDIAWISRPTIVVTRTPGSITSRIEIQPLSTDCSRPVLTPHYVVATDLLLDASLDPRKRRAVRRYRDDLVARHWITVLAHKHQRCAREVLPSLAGNFSVQATLFRIAALVPPRLSRWAQRPVMLFLHKIGIEAASPFHARSIGEP